MGETRRKTGCDYVICVMDGWWSQRGEPSFMDKFLRVRMALNAGADAVFELPLVYSLRPAQIFARGGVDILNTLGADHLSFGCETDDLSAVESAADALLHETEQQKATLRRLLSEGMSYPRARAQAMGGAENGYADKPNFILGAEYRRLERERPALAQALVLHAEAHRALMNSAHKEV